MEESREQKQSYLVAEIIDKGYDAEDFQEYLMDNSGHSINLDTWQFEDIKKFIQKYQDSKKPNKSKEDSQHSEEEAREQEEENRRSVILESSSELRKEEEVKDSGQYLQFNYHTKQENFSQVLDCVQAHQNDLLIKDVEIKVAKFLKKEGGIFEHSYYTYIVETPCLGKTVERRYNDFQWLKETLEFCHPGLPVPPIAKKGQYRRSDEKHLNKRRMILEMFLNQLVQIPELKADMTLENFLKITDAVEFEKYKSDNKKTSNVQLSKVKNTRGKLNVVIDPKTNTFLARAQRHFVDIQPETKKIYKDFKMVASLLEECANVLNGISATCESLNRKDEVFRKDNDLRYCSSNMYSVLKDSNEKYAEMLQKQAKAFRTEIYSSVKYQSLNLLNTLEAFDKLKAFQNQYVESKNALFKKKDRLYEEGVMSRWGLPSVPSSKPDKSEAMKIILPKETKELSKLRISYGLRNFLMYEETNRHFTKNDQYLANHLMKYCRIQSQINSQLMMAWVDAQTQIMGMQEGRSIKGVTI